MSKDVFALQTECPASYQVSNASLAPFRQRWDVLGDAAIEDIEACAVDELKELSVQSQKPPKNQRAKNKTPAGKDGDLIDRLERAARQSDGAARQLWEQSLNLPNWVDFNQMQVSHRMALQHAVPGGIALLAGSLVESFAAAHGAKVLVRTGRLTEDNVRRVYETAQFAADLALYDGPQPLNPAWRQVVRVRLVHALIRRAVRNQPDWNTLAWGVPINAEDYALTLYLFSYVYRRGLRLLGVPLTDAECEANFMLWRTVGYLLGVHPELLPRTRAEEVVRYRAISRRQYVPDEDSRVLAQALLRSMAGRPPFFLPYGALCEASRQLLGASLADQLHIESNPQLWSRIWSLGRGPATKFLSARRSALHAVPGLGNLAENSGRWLIRLSLTRGLGRH